MIRYWHSPRWLLQQVRVIVQKIKQRWRGRRRKPSLVIFSTSKPNTNFKTNLSFFWIKQEADLNQWQQASGRCRRIVLWYDPLSSESEKLVNLCIRAQQSKKLSGRCRVILSIQSNTDPVCLQALSNQSHRMQLKSMRFKYTSRCIETIASQRSEEQRCAIHKKHIEMIQVIQQSLRTLDQLNKNNITIETITFDCSSKKPGSYALPLNLFRSRFGLILKSNKKTLIKWGYVLLIVVMIVLMMIKVNQAQHERNHARQLSKVLHYIKHLANSSRSMPVSDQAHMGLHALSQLSGQHKKQFHPFFLNASWENAYYHLNRAVLHELVLNPLQHALTQTLDPLLYSATHWQALFILHLLSDSAGKDPRVWKQLPSIAMTDILTEADWDLLKKEVANDLNASSSVLMPHDPLYHQRQTILDARDWIYQGGKAWWLATSPSVYYQPDFFDETLKPFWQILLSNDPEKDWRIESLSYQYFSDYLNHLTEDDNWRIKESDLEKPLPTTIHRQRQHWQAVLSKFITKKELIHPFLDEHDQWLQQVIPVFASLIEPKTSQRLESTMKKILNKQLAIEVDKNFQLIERLESAEKIVLKQTLKQLFFQEIEPLIYQVNALLVTQLNQEWQQQVLKPLRRDILPFYPLNKNGMDCDLPIFVDFFHPGHGQYRQFMQTAILPLRNPSEPWQSALTNHIDWQVDYRHFHQWVTRVSNAFFQGSQGELGFHLGIYPQPEPSISRVILRVNNQQLAYANGPQEWHYYPWPDTADPMAESGLAAQHGSRLYSLTKEYLGPWGIFHVIESSQPIRVSKQLYRMAWPFNEGEGAPTHVNFLMKVKELSDPLFLVSTALPTLPEKVAMLK